MISLSLPLLPCLVPSLDSFLPFPSPLFLLSPPFAFPLCSFSPSRPLSPFFVFLGPMLAWPSVLPLSPALPTGPFSRLSCSLFRLRLAASLLLLSPSVPSLVLLCLPLLRPGSSPPALLGSLPCLLLLLLLCPSSLLRFLAFLPSASPLPLPCLCSFSLSTPTLPPPFSPPFAAFLCLLSASLLPLSASCSPMAPPSCPLYTCVLLSSSPSCVPPDSPPLPLSPLLSSGLCSLGSWVLLLPLLSAASLSLTCLVCTCYPSPALPACSLPLMPCTFLPCSLCAVLFACSHPPPVAPLPLSSLLFSLLSLVFLFSSSLPFCSSPLLFLPSLPLLPSPPVLSLTPSLTAPPLFLLPLPPVSLLSLVSLFPRSLPFLVLSFFHLLLLFLPLPVPRLLPPGSCPPLLCVSTLTSSWSTWLSPFFCSFSLLLSCRAPPSFCPLLYSPSPVLFPDPLTFCFCLPSLTSPQFP
uniref:Uncharacterized protein n=1 Tax=Knipowitschia caucasica TaxID=637954 RepID=A0AAV2M220_KNICA